jgi:hypothetical protein
LIDSNFTGMPTQHVESLDWAEARHKGKAKK